MLVPGWVSSRCAEGVLVVWERDLAAGGWSNGGEREEEVASLQNTMLENSILSVRFLIAQLATPFPVDFDNKVVEF